MSRLSRWLARGGRTRWNQPVPGVEDTGLVGWHKPGDATQAPAPAASPRPVPGQDFTEAELRKLTQIDTWAAQLATADPRRLANATTLADEYRAAFGHLSDDDLGRLLLSFSVVARDYGLAGMAGRLPGTLALAAAALTRLTRTDVHLDQRF